MRIVARNRKNRQNEKLYVFEFETMKDYEDFIQGLENVSALIRAIALWVETAKNRCDTTYARDGVACSFSMFEDEFIDYAVEMSITAAALAGGIVDVMHTHPYQ